MSDELEHLDEFRFYRAMEGELDGTLLSPRGEYTWGIGVNFAQCASGHRPPGKSDHCGLWGLMSPELAATYWGMEVAIDSDGGKRPLIFVECLAYGRYLRGDEGCRVEAAEIRAILDVRQGIDLSPWADRYKVPIVMSGLDLAITIEGTVDAFNIPVDAPAHVGVKIGDRVLNVRTSSRLVFELWQVPLGTRIRVVRDLHDDARPVVAYRALTEG